MFRSLALLILLIGIVLITVGYSKTTLKCPPPQIEYRLVPRTFFEEQMSNQNLTQLDMFSNTSFNGNHYDANTASNSDRENTIPINIQNIFN